MTFEPLKDVFERVLSQRNVRQTYDAAEACAMSERIIAAELPLVAGRVRARCVRGDTLHLAVQHATVGSEIHFASATILHEIQQRFPRITKLRTTSDPGMFRDPLE